MVEHAVELGEEGPGPRRALGDLHAEHRLDAEDDAELVAEGGEPVVPVGQDGDLAVVAHLEELFGAAVHVADDRVGGDDALAVEGDPQPQHPVGGRVLGADVEHHVGTGERPVADPDVEGPGAGGARGARHARQYASGAVMPCGFGTMGGCRCPDERDAWARG